MKLPSTALLALSLAAPAASAQSIGLVRLVGGLERPTSLTSAPDGSDRLFVTLEKRGIVVIEDGFLRTEPFLYLWPDIGLDITGLTSLAFHPDYASNGRFYVVYQNTAHESFLVEYQVSADPNLADPASANVILGPVPQPDILHDWNCARFGPDGMLYLSCGDGGPGFDPQNRAQDLSLPFGKILRIDVDAPPPHVPPDNPFVGVPGADERIWAYGLRMPWRISFDRLTGDLWIADVGQDQVEEVDFQPAASAGGENYGWVCMEGDACTGLGSCTCNAPALTPAIHQYTHTGGMCCVVGGFVYRGAAMPWLQGAYVFGDYCSARLFSLRYDGTQVTELLEHTAGLDPCDGSSLDLIASIDEDADGELYLLDYLGGDIFRLVPGDETVWSYCVGAPNSAGPGAEIGHAGTTSVGANDLVLTATGAIPGQPAVFYHAPDRVQLPFGNGFRCAAGPAVRLQPVLTVDGSGMTQLALDLAGAPPQGGGIDPGDSRSFQLWYRDPAAGGSNFNLSDALRVVFCP
jgi:glucose/arabinose dehydrogenase